MSCNTTARVSAGTEAVDPTTGRYSSWIVVKTNDEATGTVKVDGITLRHVGDSTSAVSEFQFRLPAPTIVKTGAPTYEWRTID